MDQLPLRKGQTRSQTRTFCKDFEWGKLNALMYIMNITIAGRDKGTMLMKIPAGNISYTQIVN